MNCFKIITKFWGFYTILLCSACSQEKFNIETNSSEPVAVNQESENNRLPLPCQDSDTIQTIREIVLENAAKTAKSEAQKDFINQTEVSFQNIVIENQATEDNLVNSCSADIKIQFPFATNDEKSKVLADMVIASAMIKFKPQFAGRVAYESKFSYNDGRKDNYFVLHDAETYASSVQIFTRLYSNYKDGFSIISGKVDKEKGEIQKPQEDKSTQDKSVSNQEQEIVKKEVSVKEISNSDVQWTRRPMLAYEPADLQGENRHILLDVDANQFGIIRSVQVLESTGVPELDETVARSVRQAKFKPYKENGVAYPIKVKIPFDLR